MILAKNLLVELTGKHVFVCEKRYVFKIMVLE